MSRHINPQQLINKNLKIQESSKYIQTNLMMI